jgi:hypothetical protein
MDGKTMDNGAQVLRIGTGEEEQSLRKRERNFFACERSSTVGGEEEEPPPQEGRNSGIPSLPLASASVISRDGGLRSGRRLQRSPRFSDGASLASRRRWALWTGAWHWRDTAVQSGCLVGSRHRKEDGQARGGILLEEEEAGPEELRLRTVSSSVGSGRDEQ